MKAFVVVVLAGLALLAATSSTVRAAGVGRHPLGMVTHHGTQGANAVHAARTTPAAGRAGTPTCNGSACTGYESAINQYFTDVAADNGKTTNVYSVATQYCQGVAFGSTSCGGGGTPITYNESFGGSYVDTTPYPANGCSDAQDTWCLNDTQLHDEIQSDIAAKGWPAGTSTSLYFIFTPSNVGVCIDNTNASCTTNAFCAYHTWAPDNTIYAVEPYDATISGCNSAPSPNGNDGDATINTISHEQNESITDPYGNGWYSADLADNFPENGDLCAWTFGNPLGSTAHGAYNQVINSHDYELQLEYSNGLPSYTVGCVPYLNGPVTTPIPTLGDGIGPLVYHSDPVMTTNTVYAIYWFPGAATAPSSSGAPVVSGVAAVGQALSTTDGAWNNSPTSYAYQWQSCSSGGTSCTDIPGATTSSYTLQASDAGHEILSKISATNAAGTTQALSSPTAVVVDVPKATAKPLISGKAKVGRHLSAGPGSWSWSPTSFHYEWLRCSAAGGHCAPIKHAAAATYKLATADVGHRLRVKVTAVNLAGSASSTSSTTQVVKH